MINKKNNNNKKRRRRTVLWIWAARCRGNNDEKEIPRTMSKSGKVYWKTKRKHYTKTLSLYIYFTHIDIPLRKVFRWVQRSKIPKSKYTCSGLENSGDFETPHPHECWKHQTTRVQLIILRFTNAFLQIKLPQQTATHCTMCLTN